MEVDHPSVSVVIPCFNAERWVGRAIDSILVQTGVSVEVIAIDDGSTDGSLNVIGSYGGSICCETGPNRGACSARNRGLELASADYVMFLDADDFIEGPLLKGQFDALERTGSDCCISPVADGAASGDLKQRRVPRTNTWEQLVVDWLDGYFVPPCGLMWRRETLVELGGWNEALSKNQDGELVLRAAVEKATFCTSISGQGVYWHHSSPDRISQVTTSEKLQDSLSVYLALYSKLSGTGSLTDSLNASLSRATHKVERAAVKVGLLKDAHRIALIRRRHNWKRYEGTFFHVLVCHLVGLVAKERIAYHLAFIRRIRQRQ